MKKIFFLLTIASVLLSCEKAIMPNSESADAEKTFETLWQTVDRGYSFFEYKNIDWNNVYQTYRSQINNNMTDREFFSRVFHFILQ